MWADLRDRCPVAHTDRHGGSYMPVRYEDISAVAHDTVHFSSRDVSVTGLSSYGNPLVAPPITADPPLHTESRRLLLPAFSPKAIDRLEPLTRNVARSLLDAIAERGDGLADGAVEYAQHLPTRVIGHMLGIPLEHGGQFTDWAITILQLGPLQPDLGRQATREVLDYFREQVAQRREERGEDLISYLLDAEMGGAPLTEKHVLGTCWLLLLAGMDTTWNSISSGLWHLATHPEDRQRLVDEPSLIPTAVEEFLRAYAPVTMAREVVAETTVGDRTVCPGERVLLSFPAGNRDPEQFPDAEEIRIDREQNRHFAFGIGIHRCLGSNLARMELRVAFQEWLARFPSFSLDPDRPVVWTGGQVRGPRTVPLRLG